MKKKRVLLLKAVEHNWDMIGPGEWYKVTWRIYYDGSYEIFSTFNPPDEAYEKENRPKPVRRKTSGTMEEAEFSKFREAMKREPWRDPSLIVDACDGEAWEIESYNKDGSIDKSSGKLGYIYGHSVLETIVSLLPSDGTQYSSSAFISVTQKD